ncbi:nucleoside hydrolase [Bombilactobacillus thymidiniphilus]|uniref:Nucleoside hydrolase n=1 Tax=Bombilactobacillus thymidiniphilus TaxID=2923363 RepID=A0ABY4PFJ2_9LACO|nr:nucleoside hydrolase [Bombilactobacillus thymidiniphilus]UQS84279.1 nucleoside hydrolase [Bombilactobacillus thymidiniphilus]
MVEKIVFDCDPGSDDSIAILETFAHPDKLEVLGMTSVGGNQILSNVTRNLQHILWFLKQQTPIASGQAQPIIKNLHNASEFHGTNGLAGPTFPPEADAYPIQSHNAITFLHNILSKSIEPITVVATAPLTNIALLLKVFPEDRTKIKRFVIMGGALKTGNVTPNAEFNFYVDPDAAHIVLASGIETVLCGLDVTNQTAIADNEITALANKGPASQLAYEILVPYAAAELKHHTLALAPIHDLTTISYLLKPELFSGQKLALQVNTTWSDQRGAITINADPAALTNVLVLDQVKRAEVIKLLVTSLEYLDQQLS